MGRYELEYPKDAQNLIKRYGNRGIYALQHIHGLINSSQLLHVSFNPPNSPFPVTLPMIGQMGSFDRPSADLGDPLDLYLHGYVSMRMTNLARKSTKPEAEAEAAGETKDEDQPEGMPVCISVAHVDGLILAVSAFNHSYNYRSAVLFGHATIVSDPEEKLYAMELITNSVVPDRWRNTRLPPTKAEMDSTSILRVKIASGSAKYRDGGVSDDRNDLKNVEALEKVWTGVLPVYQTIGEPLPTEYNKVELPAHVSEFVKDFNTDNKENALAAAAKKYGG